MGEARAGISGSHWPPVPYSLLRTLPGVLAVPYVRKCAPSAPRQGEASFAFPHIEEHPGQAAVPMARCVSSRFPPLGAKAVEVRSARTLASDERRTAHRAAGGAGVLDPVAIAGVAAGMIAQP